MAHSDFIFLCHFRLVYKLCLWLRQTDNVKENSPYLNERGESGPAQFSWRELCLLTEKKGNSYLQLTSLPPGSQQAAKLQWELPRNRDGETEV